MNIPHWIASLGVLRAIRPQARWIVGALFALLCCTLTQAAYVNRYNTIANGAITFTGNTIGLNKAASTNAPGTSGAIGAFITTNTTLRDGTYPFGTTANYTLNASSAVLNIPVGSTVLYAELIWGGSYSFGGEDVSAQLGNAVTMTTPGGTFSVSPVAATAQTLGTKGAGGTCSSTIPCFYVRSANVTAMVQSGGAGTYTVGAIPATQGDSDANSNNGGWTLAVVYGNGGLPARNMTLFVGAEVTNGTTSTAATVSGFCTPASGPRSGRLLASAMEGDSGVTGDQMTFGPTAASRVAISGPNNPLSNFFASQINGDSGALDTSGSFGSSNSTPGGNTSGARQGWDITNVDVSSTLVNSQTSAVAQGTSTGDQYVISTLALQINVGSPSFPTAAKTVDRAVAAVGDTLTYTIVLNNTTGTTDATNVVFTDTPPPGTSFIANSLTKNGTVQSGASPLTGFNVGTIAAGASVTLSFKVLVNSIPASPAPAQFSNTASWTYQYISCVGQPTTNGSLTTNPVVSTAVRLEPTKTVSPSGPVAPGTTLTYTITVPNTGTANSAASTLQDAIPAGTTYVANSTTLNGTAVADVAGVMPFVSARTINSPTRPAGQINAGETATIVFKVTVNANPGVGPIVNTASIDPDGAGAAAAVTATVSSPITLPDLAISKYHGGIFTTGDTGTYTLQVSSTATSAPITAGPITVTDTLPTGMTVAAVPVATNWDCSATVVGAAVASCTYTGTYPIAAGTVLTPIALTVNVGPTTAANSTNTASVSTITGESVTSNNTTTDPTAVLVKPTIAKAFSPTQVLPGATSTLTLTITNSGTTALTNVAFSDTFPSGLVVAATPALTNTCGGTITGNTGGATALSLANGSMNGNTTCVISIAVTAAASGVYNNGATGVSSTETGSAGAPSNIAQLSVLAPPTIAKSFSPPAIGINGASTLTITITNPNAAALNGVAFTDSYPNGLKNTATPSVTNTCGGTLSGGTANGTSIGLSGGALNANASCTVNVQVTSATNGSYTNTTSAVTSTNGGAGNTASATLVVSANPSISKSFAPTNIVAGGVSTVTFVLGNSAIVNATAAGFTDSLPFGMVVAATPSVTNTCGGTVSASAGNTAITLSNATINASGSCTVSVKVTAAASGNYPNTASAVSSSLGSGDPSNTATLTVMASPTIVKSFSPPTILANGTSLLTFVITNPSNGTLTGLAFTDNFPAGGLRVAATPNISNTCSGTIAGGSPGSTVFSLSGGTLAANASCTISVLVTSPVTGAFSNTTTGVSSNEAATGAGANATLLTVVAPNLRLSKSHSGNFTAGAAGSYTLSVDNIIGTASTSGTITVVDTLPTGLSYVASGSGGGGWTCSNVGAVVTCSTNTALAAGATATPMTINVNVDAIAIPSVLNSAQVSGGGEPAANTVNNSAYDFTVVQAAPQSSFSPDNAQSTTPGSTVFYAHVFNAGVAGTLTFSTTASVAPVSTGWSQVLYRDTNCNGTLDGAEATSSLSGAISVSPADTVCIVVKDSVPANAPFNAQNQILARATLTPIAGAPIVYVRVDLTTVSGLGGALTLQKTVRNVTLGGTSATSNVASPGQLLEYVITYANNSAATLGNISVHDATPAYTSFVSASCGAPLPAGITGCSVSSAPALNAAGPISWTLSGSLQSAASGTLVFRVNVQ